MLLEPNVGLTDRYWRITVGAVLLGCGVARLSRGHDLLGYAGTALGGMFLADGILGSCPLYTPFGVDTRAAEWDDPRIMHAEEVLEDPSGHA